MGFFKNLFGSREIELKAPVTGLAVPITQVNDPTFSDEILGKGIAIIPTQETVCAPCDATVSMVFDTGHAVSLMADCGAEILIHIGLDTVKLRGKHFRILVKNDEKVTCGQPLIEFEREAILAEGYDLITPMVICNSDEFSAINPYTDKTVVVGDLVLGLVKK